MESKIIEFPETIADPTFRDEHGSIYEAECELIEVIESLKQHVALHNMLMRAVGRYREICEKGAMERVL